MVASEKSIGRLFYPSPRASAPGGAGARGRPSPLPLWLEADPGQIAGTDPDDGRRIDGKIDDSRRRGGTGARVDDEIEVRPQSFADGLGIVERLLGAGKDQRGRQY